MWDSKGANYYFRDKNISLKAKGLLSQMLSLPEDWEYSINGLAAINKEGRDGINATLKELNTNLSIHHGEGVMEDVGDIKDMDVVSSLAKIRNQIEYDKLCNTYGVELIDGLMSLFEDVFYTTNKTLRVGGVSKSMI